MRATYTRQELIKMFEDMAKQIDFLATPDMTEEAKRKAKDYFFAALDEIYAGKKESE